MEKMMEKEKIIKRNWQFRYWGWIREKQNYDKERYNEEYDLTQLVYRVWQRVSFFVPVNTDMVRPKCVQKCYYVSTPSGYL